MFVGSRGVQEFVLPHLLSRDYDVAELEVRRVLARIPEQLPFGRERLFKKGRREFVQRRKRNLWRSRPCRRSAKIPETDAKQRRRNLFYA